MKQFVIGAFTFVFTLISAIFLCPAAQADTSSGLAAYYPFDGSAADGSGNGNDGIANGPVSVQGWNGSQGGAYSFDGVDDYILVANSADLEPDIVTVSLWVKGSELRTFQYLIAKGNAGCIGASWALYTGGSQGLYFYIYTGGGYILSADAGTNVWDGSWHHVAGVFDGSQIQLFVDGAEILPATATTGPVAYGSLDDNDLHIGQFPPGCGAFNFKGDLDDIRIYDRALSETEIQDLYSTPPTTCPVTINPDLSFSLTDLQLKFTPSKVYNFEAEFSYFGEQGGVLLWKLDDLGLKTNVQCPVSLDTDLSFQLPYADFVTTDPAAPQSIWADFTYWGEQNGAYLWSLAGAGTN